MKGLTMNILIWICVMSLSCGTESTDSTGPNGANGTNQNNDWLIPINKVFDGGPGKDGIPALENPKMKPVSQINYLEDADFVIGFKSGDDVRAYPHPILDWHEIINDDVDTTSVAITYCPLTGTAIGWSRNLNGQKTTFGVSGLLYNTNLIPYDRLTDSNWTQIGMRCVNGELIGDEVKTMRVVETTWGTWKDMYPDSEVVTTNTGFSRNYQRYPYGSYRTNDNQLFFPVEPFDERLPAKERVLGVLVDDEVRAFRFDYFSGGTKVLVDSLNGEKFVVVGNKEANFMVAFEYNFDQNITLSALQDGANVLRDSKGNQYNIFGEAIAGPDAGSRLGHIRSFIGYWFSFPAFYDEVSIYSK